MEMMPGSLLDFSQIARDARAGAVARAANGLQGNNDPTAAREAAIEFEAVFLAQMLAPMFDTLSSDGMFGGGPGEDIYRSLMVEEYGRAIARAGGIGITDTVQREMLKIQEAASQ